MKNACFIRLWIFVCFAVLFACHSSRSDSAVAHSTKNSASKKPRLIIFIHGIHGSPQDTWQATGGPYWPKLIQDDPAFHDAEVIEPGYPTPFTGNRNDVDAISASLAQQLKPAIASHQEVIFICHSLGGLVVKQMLLDNPDFAKKVPFIVFYATPGSGSFVARFGSFFSGDPLLRSMSSSGDNQYLIDLENRWRGANYATHRFCAYEDRKMRPHDLTAIITGGTADAASKLSDFIGGMYVVDPGSATYGCDSNAKFTKIDANHLGIVKPTGLGDPIYTLFKKYYESDGKGPITAVVQTSEVRFDKVLCGFYGAADQRKPAWNADEVCPIENPQSLDQSYKQTVFIPSYKASSKMTAAEIPPGLEIETDGGYYWSVDRGRWNEDHTAYLLHTYCGPSGSTEGGCNVKVKIIGHYKTTTSDASPVLK